MKRMKKRELESESLNKILVGILIIGFSIGSIFSLKFVRYGYWIIIGVTLIMFYYFNNVLRGWYRNIKVNKVIQIVGFIGVFLIFLFFGIQSPQMLFKKWFLGMGIAFLLWGFIKFKLLK